MKYIANKTQLPNPVQLQHNLDSDFSWTNTCVISFFFLDVSQLQIFEVIHFKWEIHAKPDSLLRYNKAVYSKVAFEIQYINENSTEFIKY